MTSLINLRAAAAKIRALAEEARAETADDQWAREWTSTPDEPDYAWIRAMGPAAVEPLASWLENTADWVASGEPCPYAEAEAFARSILEAS